MLRFVRLALLSIVCFASVPLPAHTPAAAVAVSQKASEHKKDADHKPIDPGDVHNATLWRDPGNIAAKDMFEGPGGKAGRPRPPFTFLEEQKHDSNPKFDVRDANGQKWRVKLGAEARPEPVATRLLWAIGYYTDEDYTLPLATIHGLHLRRGKKFIRNGNQVVYARFARKRDDQNRIAAWDWKHNPFLGTREFNGLRVMIAVINDYDLKNENNAVYLDPHTHKQLFLVSDTGASFGTNSTRIKNANGKGNVKQYKRSKFITKTTATEVDFGTPAPPNVMVLETAGLLFPMYFRHNRYDWIGDHIPRKDARWIGSLLGQLTHQQLVEAFRAGQFTPEEVDQYVAVLEKRIAQLKAL